MVRAIGAALCGALVVALIGAAAAAPATRPAERELLGVRIWRDYAAVLKRHGEPTRVVPGIAMPPETSAGSINVSMQGARSGAMGMPGGPMMGGAMMGGMGMLSGPPGMPMMGGMASAGGAMGAPGARGGTSMGLAMGGGRSMSGAPMGMGRPMGGFGGRKDEDEDDTGLSGPVAGAGGAPRGAMGGGGGMMSPPQYGMTAPPGMSGGMMGGITLPPGGLMGGMGGPMMGGVGPQVGAQVQAPASIPSEEVKETWVYVRGANTFHFMFNRDGRVIRIQSFGTKGVGATSRSINLGDQISKVYKAYGWAGATIKQGNSVTLDYSQKAHVVFDLLDRGDRKGLRVVGITVAPSEGRK